MRHTLTLIILSSNLRLLDCINRPKDLINRAIELGLKGIAITDHECLSGHIKCQQITNEIHKEHPDFKVILGNEIYLCADRSKNQKYYHFILLAKNAKGHKALRELSSRAWLNSYFDRGMERVVTTYDDLQEVVEKYPNSLIAQSACLGGQLSSQTLEMCLAEERGDNTLATLAHNDIVNFIFMCKGLFGDDFYIECAPGCSKEQIMVNRRLLSISHCFDIPMVTACDAHYLKKEDRFVHKAYLTSQNGEREVDDFYEYCYLQSNEEIIEHLKKSSYDDIFIEQMFLNSIEIYNKIEDYSLLHKQTIPKVPPHPFKKQEIEELKSYPHLSALAMSDDEYDRHWVNECYLSLKEKERNGKIEAAREKEYLDELEHEADIKQAIGEKLETNIFRYPLLMQHYIDLIWDCGSTIGAGRGSSCAGLNHMLLGVTQLDPIKWNLPFFRYLNKERVDFPDIDIDICPSKRPLILQKIKEERGQNFISSIDEVSKKNLGCTLIATFGSESTKAAILTSCRGYRSEEYPDGIDSDIAQYLTSLIPSERGFVWSLHDAFYGNEDKGRRPIRAFIEEVNKYDRLKDIMLSIEGLYCRRGSHASGVIMFDEDPYQFGCFMRTPSGDVITQYDLHDDEAAGLTKIDFLVTEVQDKIIQTIQFLQKDGLIDENLSIREAYNKYIHPDVLPINDIEMWDNIRQGKIISLFQFDTEVGSQGVKKVQPNNILELSDTNGLIRLMPEEKGVETPLEKYVRFKNDISQWYNEMSRMGITKEEQKVLERHFLRSYGVPPSQEQMMQMVMDKDICNFSLAEANDLRKVVAKKQMSRIPEMREKIMTKATSKAIGEYVWKCGIGPQMG